MSPRIIITHSKDWNWQVRLSTKKTALSQKKVTIDFNVEEFNSFSSTSPGANLFGCKVGREQSSLSKKTDRVVRSTALDWHYLSHHVCFLVAFSIHREFGSINPTSVKCYHRMNENKWYLPPHPPHWMQRVKDELKTLNVRDRWWWLGFLDMAPAEIPLADGVVVG